MRTLSLERSNMAWVGAALLADAPSWDAGQFCGPAARVAFAPDRDLSLDALGAECIEGWRITATQAEAFDTPGKAIPLYRHGNVGCMRLVPEPVHWRAPTEDGPWCARPGDVVVSKSLPTRAAIVGDRTHRHPVDATCFIIRGLEPTTAVWLALCLNQVEYGRYLARGQIIPRISAATLRELRVPRPPFELASSLTAVMNWVARSADSSAALGHALLEVEREVSHLAAEVKPSFVQDAHKGLRISAAALTQATWIPVHVLAAAGRERLARAGWVALRDLAHSTGRSRLSALDAASQAVRLADVERDLYVPAQLSQINWDWVRRFFSAPLAPEEVLLSTLVTDPKIAYVDAGAPRRAHPIDHWERLRFGSFPAAWALVLMTSPVREQLLELGVGSVQQYARSDDLLSVRVPPLPPEKLSAWNRAVARHHALRRELDTAWAALWPALMAAFDRAHPTCIGGSPS